MDKKQSAKIKMNVEDMCRQVFVLGLCYVVPFHLDFVMAFTKEVMKEIFI
jgi:hypothetical protein